ncbi:hypothetical protein L2E82_29142 [Cichorium intybus]|uniref:Uncharacterized protein n=1 Tax=Cichorium intybus TaxID=13427 RepID=A0ACB9CXJ5_CICIN|nr:hypothetical protein L2E82_29142 [Cichorium intybus]
MHHHKWWWRLRKEPSALWSRLIGAIHGLEHKPPDKLSASSSDMGIRTLTRQLPTKLFRVPSLLLPISPKIPHAESIQPDPLSSSSSLLHCGHRRL